MEMISSLNEPIIRNIYFAAGFILYGSEILSFLSALIVIEIAITTVIPISRIAIACLITIGISINVRIRPSISTIVGSLVITIVLRLWRIIIVLRVIAITLLLGVVII